VFCISYTHATFLISSVMVGFFTHENMKNKVNFIYIVQVGYCQSLVVLSLPDTDKSFKVTKGDQVEVSI